MSSNVYEEAIPTRSLQSATPQYNVTSLLYLPSTAFVTFGLNYPTEYLCVVFIKFDTGCRSVDQTVAFRYNL
jgi:hypothetical protein